MTPDAEREELEKSIQALPTYDHCDGLSVKDVANFVESLEAKVREETERNIHGEYDEEIEALQSRLAEAEKELKTWDSIAGGIIMRSLNDATRTTVRAMVKAALAGGKKDA